MAESVRVVESGTDENGEPIKEVQFGGEYNGVFVPFVTKSLGYVEALAKREQANQEAEGESEQAS